MIAMGVNKVDFGGETLIDLTGDTISPETVRAGYTGHDKSGNPFTGTFEGIIPNGTKIILENGAYDVKEFANVSVEVDPPEGSIVPSGDSPPITSNGTFNVRQYENAVVDVPTGVFPIGNLSDEVIIRASGNSTHKATIPAGYYVENDLILSEWKTGQVTANGTKGAALTVPYSAIGFVPKVGFVILNAGSVSTNAMLCFMTIPAGSRYLYRTSSGVTSAGSLNATFDTNGMSFPAANSSSAYTVNQYRWFALR